METMYPGFTNSPATTLTSDITDVATTIPVAELGVFPAAPNIAVIGTGDDAETILYAAKSAATGAGNLTGCTREFDKTGTYGQKLAWLSATVISRNFANIDLYALQTNISLLNTQTNKPTTLWAYDGISPTIDSAELNQVELAGTGFPLPYAAYTKAGVEVEKLYFISKTTDADDTLYTSKIEWTCASSVSTLAGWVLKAVRISTTGLYATTLQIVATLPAAAYVGSAYAKQITADSSQFTIPGSGYTILWELQRVSAGNTMDEDALFIDAQITKV